MRSNRFLHSVFVLLILTLGAHASAAELSLDDAKEQGLVGEQYDGYLGAVAENPDAAVRALVNDVNGKRKSEYQRIADANDLALADVEALAGRKSIKKTAPGHYVKLQGEDWRTK